MISDHKYGKSNLEVFATCDSWYIDGNHAKGFHNALKKFCGAIHLSFWKFLDLLILQHNLTRLDVIKDLGNVPPPPRRRKYRMIDDAIFDNYDIASNLLSYLEAIAGQSVFGI